jgi:hypothetical protein
LFAYLAADIGKERPGVLRLAGIMAILEYGMIQCTLPPSERQRFDWRVRVHHLQAAMATAECSLRHRNIVTEALRNISPIFLNPKQGRGKQQQLLLDSDGAGPSNAAAGPSNAAAGLSNAAAGSSNAFTSNYDEPRYPPFITSFFT